MHRVETLDLGGKPFELIAVRFDRGRRRFLSRRVLLRTQRFQVRSNLDRSARFLRETPTRGTISPSRAYALRSWSPPRLPAGRHSQLSPMPPSRSRSYQELRTNGATRPAVGHRVGTCQRFEHAPIFVSASSSHRDVRIEISSSSLCRIYNTSEKPKVFLVKNFRELRFGRGKIASNAIERFSRTRKPLPLPGSREESTFRFEKSRIAVESALASRMSGSEVFSRVDQREGK